MTDTEGSGFTRRKFIGTMAAAGALFVACGRGRLDYPELPPHVGEGLESAPDGPPLKAGLIGCGGRGTGAALDFLNAGPNLHITALADVFEDRLESCRSRLKETAGVEIADENCFLGFDAYKKLIDSGVDVVLQATPPHFRPEHFAACVDAGKHVFMEKPLAVDPVGVRTILAATERAKTRGLCVVTGTQQRHSRDFVETYKRVADGAIGEIVAANCWYNTNQLWYREREPGWSDMEYMIRDWVNWRWLSGDHIVEQFIHKIDTVNWFLGEAHPIKAVGVGGRHRRVTGDQYDFFSIDYVYEGEIHVHGMCRQIDGCATNRSHYVRGTKGYTNCKNTIWRSDGTVLWQYPYPVDETTGQPMTRPKVPPTVQEHIHLVTAIRTGVPINTAEATAYSTLTTILGREAAYTGQEVTWDEMMASDMRLGPTEYTMGPVEMEVVIPVPGTSKEPV